MSKIVSVSRELAGKTLTLEIGKIANQADSAVWVQYGDTVVLVTVVVGRDNPGLGYFPLSVEYMERLYASGKIKGSRWVKREGRPSDTAVLTGRLVDRAIRPLFDKNFTREVQILMTELSYDGEADLDVASFIGTSAALAISPAPWSGPLGGTKVGLIDGNFVANPSPAQIATSSMELFVAGTQDVVNMIEAGAAQIPDEQFVQGVEFAHQQNQLVIELINELVAKVNPVKISVPAPDVSQDLQTQAAKTIKDYIDQAKKDSQDLDFNTAFQIFKDAHVDVDSKLLDGAFSYQWKKAIRAVIASGIRTDGRKYDEIRPISAEVGVLPRVHGSALFSRGTTQALTVATLATPAFGLMIETTTEEVEKHYIHHYNFPPFSVGETDRMSGPKRREIGHGALAEKALLPVIPPLSQFPYTIRVVSDIMSSNGSTSQASVSGSTLALMDAGVPILAPVAGVAMGLISDAPEGPMILSDIAGIEDFNGDMDFKVAGTATGITAVQLDVKITGLSLELVAQIIDRARQDRLFILDKMTQAIAQPREHVSLHAPKVEQVTIPVDKIGEVIGPGGRMIRRIIAETGATVDVEDDGTVMISSSTQENLDKAVNWVKNLTTEPEVGQLYEGTVTRMMNFGAFVEIFPGREGLVHVSQMSHEYVESPEDIVSVGDQVTVKVSEIDDMGRVNLTMLLDSRPEDGQGQERRGRDNNGGGGGRPRQDGGRPRRQERRYR